MVYVPSETTIREITEILVENEFHTLPIVGDDTLVVIVTTTDLINYLLKQS